MRAAGDVRLLLVSTLLALAATGALASPAAAQAPGQTPEPRPIAADPLQHRLAQATHVRGALRARWEALGAVPRPPRPAALVEEPGEPPVDGARWLPGAWAWIEGRWVWHPGSWVLPGEPVPADVAALGLGFGFDLAFDADTGGGRPDRGPRIRDHRGGRDETVRIRDHRDDAKADDRKDDRKDDKVRDHRDGGYDRPAPSPGGGFGGSATIRDHRR